MASSAIAAPPTRLPWLHRHLLRAAALLLLMAAYSATTASAQLTLESKSGPLFIINDKQSRNHLANYVGYRITNTSGAAYSDLTVTLNNFQGGIVSLANNEDGAVYLGPLANGASATVFFYLKASAETALEQAHDVEVYESATRVETSDTTFSFVQTGDFAPVHTAIAASANKVDSVTVSGTPTVGGTYTMTVYGRTGVIGAPGDVLFSPATFPEWPADTFQLESSVISIGNPVTLTVTDDLYENLFGLSNEPYTLVYTFRVMGTTSGTIASSPLSFLASGQKIKHEDIDGSTTDSVPEVFQVTLLMSGTPTLLEPLLSDPDGGTVTYTITFTNTGTVAVDLARIVATLPNSSFGGGDPDDVAYKGTSTFDGSGISDPSISGATLTWTGPFTIAGGGSVDLTFEATFPKTVGLYTATSIAIYDGNGFDQQVDTTADMTDDVPGSAITLVSDVNLPVELVSFEAMADGHAVLLRWETASETNNAGFFVEMDGGSEGTFNQLDFVEGKGSTEFAQSYAYRIEALDPGRYAFRLKQIDYDGTFEYHPVVEALIEVPTTHFLSTAYPNPFNPQTQFRLSVAQRQYVKVDLYNALGQTVGVLFEGLMDANVTRTFTIDGSTLQSGLYLYRATGESFTESRPVLLVK